MSTETATQPEETTTIKALIPVEKQIEKLNPVRAEIAEMKSKLLAMTIGGIEDKAGYKAVEENRKLVKRKRIDTGKLTDELILPGKQYIEQIKEVGKFIETELRSIEDHLDKQSDAYEALVKAEKERKEREEMEKINQRTATLIELQMQFTGQLFVLEELHITQDELAEFDDDSFNAFVAKVKPVSEKIAADKIEAERLRLENENKLAQQKLEQEAKQKELDEQKALLDKQMKDQQDQLDKIKKMKLDARVATLSSMGMKSNGTSSDHPSCSIAHSIVSEMSDEDFEKSVRLLKEKIIDHEIEEERKRKEAAEIKARKDRFNSRRSRLMDVGLIEFTSAKGNIVTFEVSFDNKDEEGESGTSFEYIIPGTFVDEITDEHFEQVLIEAREANQKVVTLNSEYSKLLDQRKDEAKKKLEAELAPDKEKLQKLADDLRAFAETSMPELKHGAAKVIGTGIKTRLFAMAREIEESNEQF